jgi:hypothetical protein
MDSITKLSSYCKSALLTTPVVSRALEHYQECVNVLGTDSTEILKNLDELFNKVEKRIMNGGKDSDVGIFL